MAQAQNSDDLSEFEMVKQKCSDLARDHHKRALLSKGFCALINLMIQNGKRQQFGSQNSMMSTTLNRMLEGVITESKQSQLDEFI